MGLIVISTTDSVYISILERLWKEGVLKTLGKSIKDHERLIVDTFVQSRLLIGRTGSLAPKLSLRGNSDPTMERQ